MAVYYMFGSGILKPLAAEDLHDLVDIFAQRRPFDKLVALEKKWIITTPFAYSDLITIKYEAYTAQQREQEIENSIHLKHPL